MRFITQSAAAPAGLAPRRWALALVGQAVDDRGRAAHAFAASVADAVLALAYDPRTYEIEIAGQRHPAESLGEVLADFAPASLLLEATTLGFVEVFLACRAQFERRPATVSLVYAEPQEYQRPQRRRALHRRDFALSEEVEHFAAIPGAGLLLRGDLPTRVALFLGYEGARLEQVLEQTGLGPGQCVAIFGVPAFRPGWEMHSFANNLPTLRERNLREVHFAAAQSPLAAYRVLERLAAGDPDARLLIAPIGTKPHGIGAALYACAHAGGVGLIYDNPRRSSNRSTALATWHLYDIDM